MSPGLLGQSASQAEIDESMLRIRTEIGKLCPKNSFVPF
jgi:hypothetical protein